MLSVSEVCLGLSPHTEAGVPYYVVVVATNEKGSGMEEKLLFYTAELSTLVVCSSTSTMCFIMAATVHTPILPVAEPGVVEVETLPTRSSSGDSLTLSWQQPDPVLARGTITGYRVDFTEAVVGEAGRRRRQAGDCQNGTCAVVAGESQGCCEVPADETSVTIVGLDPDKAYNVSVSAINGAGTGLTQTFTVEGRYYLMPCVCPYIHCTCVCLYTCVVQFPILWSSGAESDGGSSEFPIVIVIAVVVVVVVIAVLLVLITIITVVMVKRNRLELHTRTHTHTHVHTHTYMCKCSLDCLYPAGRCRATRHTPLRALLLPAMWSKM